MQENNQEIKPLITSTKGCVGCFGVFFGICLILGVLISFSNNNKISSYKEMEINKTQFGEDWPFSVNKGILSCEGQGIVTFIANKKIYAVNGLADAARYKNIDEIWLNGKDSYQPKIGLGPIINEGLKLCDNK